MSSTAPVKTSCGFTFVLQGIKALRIRKENPAKNYWMVPLVRYIVDQGVSGKRLPILPGGTFLNSGQALSKVIKKQNSLLSRGGWNKDSIFLVMKGGRMSFILT